MLEVIEERQLHHPESDGPDEANPYWHPEYQAYLGDCPSCDSPNCWFDLWKLDMPCNHFDGCTHFVYVAECTKCSAQWRCDLE